MKKETFEEIVSKQFQGDFNKEVGRVLTQELQKRNNMTAVEWLYKNLLENPISNQDVEYNEAVFHNAKEMEKQQIIDAHGIKTKSINQDQSEIITGRQYYNETFTK